MADISDVTKYFAETILPPVCYPNGTTQASITGLPIRIFEGWPKGDQIDLDVKGETRDANGAVVSNGLGPVTNVSVFPVNVGAAAINQPIEDPQVIVAAVHGLTFTVAGTDITVSGSPSSGEYLTVIVDQKKSYSRTGADLATILAALLTDIQADYAGASLTGSVLSIPGSHLIEVRSGAPATMGQGIYRQTCEVMVTVWAPDPDTRSTVSSAIDVAVKMTLTAFLSDTSKIKITYGRTVTSDNDQARNLYRRDLVYKVEYSTIETFQAYEVTSVTNIATESNSGVAVTSVS